MTDRATRVLEAIRSHPWASTKEIEDMAQVASARDYIRRLRDMGHSISMTEKWSNGARICRYRLVEQEPISRELFQQ